jgi:peptidoglycan/xylan/chitin deacetylase (PgdA/CDA1 family)
MSRAEATACLTFDFDAMSSWITSAGSDNPSMISRGEFAIVGVQRVLEILRRHEIRATFFVPGHTVLAFPTLLERIHADGHELGHHGWGHENPADFDPAGEQRILELGLAAFDRVLGLRPEGYRSPAWALSPASVELLLAAGFRYESSCMASDFDPYYLRVGDRWSSEHPYRFGETSSLIEIPVSWGLDDFPHFELVPGLFSQLAAPEKVYGIWQGEFDYMVDHCPGGVLNLTMHPECIGRGHRLPGLERLITHMRDRGARFATLGETARDWREAHPLEAWKRANPERTGARAIQSADGLLPADVVPQRDGAGERG